jgi:ABC-type multidrug transport system fused ATPase/permease subunit
MWNYSGLRQMHHLKEKYFALILKQEQGWFDENNAYEFATKVQAQLEQISMGVGEKFGLCLTLVFMLICGLIIAFYKSWLLTLVMLAVSPFIFLCVLYLVKSLRKVIIGGRKTFEKAGGVAEEVLYNIKTVASFSNFDFEMKRFNDLIDKVHEYNKEKALKMGISIGGVLFFVFMTFFVAIMYSRILIGDQKKNDNTGDPFTPGDIMIVVLCTLIAVMSLGSVAPNIKIIQESAIASSDYFTLYEREPRIDLTNSTLKPDRDSIKGKIEFKNVDFIYPSDPNRRKILNNLTLTIEPGKKVALVGESGCGKSTTVNLIERLYECESGEVEIDGINIKNYDIEYLRNFIGYVQQEPVLFNTSIKQNLIFGRDEVVKSLGDPDELITKACSEAYAKEFIEKTEDKYDYIVGIKGSKL